jgi:hypothetical protein
MHQCPVRGCTSSVTMQKLLCYYHWRLVPRSLQRAVYRAWNGGEATPDHAARCADALAAVEYKLTLQRERGH